MIFITESYSKSGQSNWRPRKSSKQIINVDISALVKENVRPVLTLKTI
jgi:hypothetical protein